MSRSNRPIVAAFIAATSFGIGAGATTLIYAEQKHEQAVTARAGDKEKAARIQQSSIDRAGIPGALETYISNPEPAENSEAQKRDLAAQEAAAVGALWAAMLAALGLAVTSIGTILLYQQISLTRAAVKDTGKATEAMLEANKIAKRLGEAQVRCYITGVSAEIGYIDNGIAIVRCTLRNSGQSPAKDVRCTATLHHFKADMCHRYGTFRKTGYRYEIGAGSEEVASIGNFSIEWSDSEKGVFAAGESLLITLDVFITGMDVFDNSFTQSAKFSQMLKGCPNDNEWIKLPRGAYLD